MKDFDWIVHVLNDICEFGQDNDLPEISKKASLAMSVAAEEISQRPILEPTTDDTQVG